MASKTKTNFASQFTCKVFMANGEPVQVRLEGNRNKPESAQHRIEFPGGAVEVSRLSDGGGYWAHIVVNNGHWAFADCDCEGISAAFGEIVASRVDRLGEDCTVEAIPDEKAVHQIAVLIKPPKGQEQQDKENRS